MVKNPLNKRFKRELRADLGRYIALFLFLVLFIGAMSGFLVSNNSVTTNFYDNLKQSNIEDGHMSFNIKPDDDFLKQLESDNQFNLYKLYYKEISVDKANLRIYQNREEVNLACIMEGKKPVKDNEIAIDRMFADNNNYHINDYLTIDNKQYQISGLIALPDYSCLFENNGDMMFDAINFGVAITSEAGYNRINEAYQYFNYAYQYQEKIKDDSDAYTRSQNLIDNLEASIKEYDQEIINDEIDRIYQEAMVYGNPLLDELKAVMSLFDYPQSEIDKLNFDEFKNKKIDIDDYNQDEEFTSSNQLDDLREMIDQFAKMNLFNCDNLYRNLNGMEKVINNAEINDSKIITIEDYNPGYSNKAINFVMEDSKSDRVSIMLMLYIIIAIIAFVFAITTSNTISKEAGVIGTLRASGYSRKELIRHYMVLPLLLTFISGIIGNILGYLVFQNMFVGIYYTNYSLTAYQSIWNFDAFVITTIVPIVLVFVINLVILTYKLRIRPLNFLRGELKSKGRKHVLVLPHRLSFFTKFRIRILLQNISSYLILFIGIVIAGALAVFGAMFGPLLEDYSQLVIDTKIASYQYILNDQIEISNLDSESFCMTSLETMKEGFVNDDAIVYGINDDSKYVKENIPDGKVLISNSMMAKFGLKAGDEFELKEPYGNNAYKFVVAGDYPYDASIAVFMNRKDYLKLFNKDQDYFDGYFSNQKLTELKDEDVATVITQEDLTKVVNQMQLSMLEFMAVFKILSMIIFLLLMFILTKQIIEKNIKSISMSKILGFSDFEIARLYLIITSFVVLISLLVAIPLIDQVLRWCFSSYLYTKMSGYIPYIINNSCYVEMVIMGIICYLVVSIGMIFKIKKTPKGEALKNQVL